MLFANLLQTHVIYDESLVVTYHEKPKKKYSDWKKTDDTLRFSDVLYKIIVFIIISFTYCAPVA